jgi:hypothetical protein
MLAADASDDSKHLNQKEGKPLFEETVQHSPKHLNQKEGKPLFEETVQHPPVPETTNQPYVVGDEAVRRDRRTDFLKGAVI